MIGRAFDLPLAGTISDALKGDGWPDDLPATPEPGRQMQVGYALLAVLAVPIVLATAEAHLGPGIGYADVVMLCVVYGLMSVALLGVPWARLDARWSLASVALPIVFVASLSALTGGGSSPFSAIYAPVLAIAGWYLPLRYVGATLGLVISTEVWRAIALDGSRSVEQLAIMLPFAIAVAVGAWLTSTWLRRSLVSTRLDQVQMARTLEAIQGLGLDPTSDVLLDLEGAMQLVFEARASLVRLDMARSDSDPIEPSVRDGRVATILVPGTERLHGFITVEVDRKFTSNELRMAQMLAEAAGRTVDARAAQPVPVPSAHRDFHTAPDRIIPDGTNP